MSLGLPPAEKMLTGVVHSASSRLSIGNSKDSANDVKINDQMISKTHVHLELDPENGCVYVIDFSTNGSFLNGVQLPPKQGGKVLICNNDELLLKRPTSGAQEFGSIVNIEARHQKEPVK